METKTKTPTVVPMHLDLNDWDLTRNLLCNADLQHVIRPDENPRSLYTVEEMIDSEMDYLRYHLMNSSHE